MDTDSFIYHIVTEDFIKDMLEINADTNRHVTFDLSTRESIGQCPFKGRLGCFKYEAGNGVIAEFVGLQSKMYSLLLGDGTSEKKGKGVPTKCIKRLSHNAYRIQVLEPALNYVQFRRLQCKRQVLEHVEQSKKGLACFNDKVHQLTPYESVPLGHYSTKYG